MPVGVCLPRGGVTAAVPWPRRVWGVCAWDPRAAFQAKVEDCYSVVRHGEHSDHEQPLFANLRFSPGGHRVGR